MKLKEMIVLSLAVLFLIDSILLTFRANVTLGLFLVWGLTGALFCYFFFHRQIDAFCSHGIGAVLRVLFLCGFAFFVALVALMELYPLRCAPTGEERVVIVLGAGLRGGDAVGHPAPPAGRRARLLPRSPGLPAGAQRWAGAG